MLLQLLCSLSVAYGVAKVIWLAWKHMQLRSVINRIPGPASIPFIGDALKLFKCDANGFYYAVRDLSRKQAADGITKLWLGPRPLVVLYKAHAVQELLSGSKHMDKGPGYRFLEPWMGDALPISSGEKWHASRKLLTPMFHLKALAEYMHVFNKHANILVAHLDKMADGQAFDIVPYLKYCAMDSICETTIGAKSNTQSGDQSHIVRAIAKMNELIATRVMSPWLWPDLLFRLSTTGRQQAHILKMINDHSRKTIEKGRANRAAEVQLQQQNVNGDKTKPDCVDKSFEQQADGDDSSSVLADSALEKEANSLFAGIDYAGGGAEWVVYMLGCHQEQQTKVLQEVNSVLGDSENSELTIDNITKLKYLDSFVKETLRLYPVGPWYSRNTSESCRIAGFEIPAGVEVMVFSPQLHRDPEFFPDPEKFAPERWLTADKTTRHPYCYTPFSVGLRSCIGERFALLQIKTMVCYILRKFTLSCTVKREEIVPVALPTLRPSVPVHVTLRRKD